MARRLSQLSLDAARYRLVYLSHAEHSSRRLREHFKTRRNLSEASEEFESDSHPQLIRMW
jgi:hypothetical protein